MVHKIIFFIFLIFYYHYFCKQNNINKNKSNKESIIYFVIQDKLNHINVKDSGTGASELLFYMTAYEISKIRKVIILNFSETQTINTIEYQHLYTNYSNIKNINNAIIIIQRDYELVYKLHQINNNNRYIIWCHDFLSGTKKSHQSLFGNLSYSQINSYFNKHNIDIVSVSDFHKRNILNCMPNINVKVIYNGLFSYLFNKENININKDYLIFASASHKGLNKVIEICREYYKINKKMKLLIIRPSYDSANDINIKHLPFINIIGNIKNKIEYSSILKNCLLLFGSSFPETFCCVVAEALHLGVPVIGDNSYGVIGYHEIIDKEYLCNYNNIDEVIDKIKKIYDNRPPVSLNNKFYYHYIINEWLNYING